MSRIRFFNCVTPVAPSSSRTELFVSSADKKAYLQDDTGELIRLNTGVGSGISADVSIAAATNNVVVGGSGAIIPANMLQVGDIIRVTILGSFTQASADTAVALQIHLGTAGTVADAIILTFAATSGVGTSIARIVAEGTIRSVGVSGTIVGAMQVLQHAGAIVGYSAATSGNSEVQGTTTTTPDTTVQNKLTVSILSAASGITGTIKSAFIEIIK